MSLQHAPRKRLVVDFDKPGAPVGGGGRKCDYLFIADSPAGKSGWIAPLELKRGALRASEVVGQLRAGAAAAERMVPGCMLLRFRPVAAYGSLHKLERAALRENRNKIAFRGRTEAVRLMKCGDRLIKALGP